MNRRIHFIGICGVAMSALALAFKKEGYVVTGSDVGFYPPVSTHLKDAGVDFYPGWHVEKMIANGMPDLVVVGNVASSHNPEWLYVQERKLNYKSYPEVVREFFVKQSSLVCAGTYGKSTSTALLAWIFKAAGLTSAHLFGCIAVNDLPAAALSESDWSILEGDEYKSARWDNSPKFSHYAPTHLLLTSVVWDHADVYPTEELYAAAFKKLISAVPANGIKIISEKVDPHLVGNAPAIRYGQTAGNDYVYGNIQANKNGVTFDIFYQNQTFPATIPCLGEFMADNATGCFAMAHKIGIDPKIIVSAIANFPGLKRRLEKRYKGDVTIFDDIAHSPTKAQANLTSLRKIYSGKITAIFEPNTGNRERQALAHYAHAFVGADEVIIPRLTKIKSAPDLPLPVEGDELAQVIAETHTSVRYIDDDHALLAYVQQKIQPGDVVVFLGSHGFRGMIEELVRRLTK